MPSENITIRSGINPSKFMGSSHAAGSSLEERVGNNERKITLLKNIINYKDSLLPIPKPEESDNTNLNISDRLDNIGEALGLIGGLFKLQLSSLQDKEAQDLKDKAEEDKRLRESNLEAKKQDKKKKKDTGFKVPGKGIIGNLQRFFTNVALGAASIKVLDWLKDPANQKNVTKVATWLKDNAKTIFTGLFVLAGLDIASKVLFLAQGMAQVMLWLGGAPLLIGGIILALGSLGLKTFWDIGAGLREGEKRRKELTVKEGWKKSDGSPNYEGRNDYHRFLATKKVNPDHPYWKNITYEDHLKRRGLTSDMTKLEGGRVPFSELKSLSGIDTTGWAKGGRPPVGEVVLTGEEGRELFVADTSGTIISNDKTEHVFDGGALLVAKSNTMDKVSGISQRVSKKKTPNLIDLRGGKGSSSNPTFNTGDQISSVSSEDSSNIDIFTGSLSYGLVG